MLSLQRGARSTGLALLGNGPLLWTFFFYYYFNYEARKENEKLFVGCKVVMLWVLEKFTLILLLLFWKFGCLSVMLKVMNGFWEKWFKNRVWLFIPWKRGRSHWQKQVIVYIENVVDDAQSLYSSAVFFKFQSFRKNRVWTFLFLNFASLIWQSDLSIL